MLETLETSAEYKPQSFCSHESRKLYYLTNKSSYALADGSFQRAFTLGILGFLMLKNGLVSGTW